MENASKALIIAGAILLAILLISLGIMVYNQAKGTVNDADLSAEAAQTFNTKFTSYGGTQSGTKLNSLLDAVTASNGTSRKSIKVKVTGFDVAGSRTGTDITTATEDSSLFPTFLRTDKGEVTFTYDAEGYVNLITIKGPNE